MDAAEWLGAMVVTVGRCSVSSATRHAVHRVAPHRRVYATAREIGGWSRHQPRCSGRAPSWPTCNSRSGTVASDLRVRQLRSEDGSTDVRRREEG